MSDNWTTVGTVTSNNVNAPELSYTLLSARVAKPAIIAMWPIELVDEIDTEADKRSIAMSVSEAIALRDLLGNAIAEAKQNGFML